MSEQREYQCVALMGCSKQKMRTQPDRPVPVRDLHAPSHLFRLQLAEAEATCQHVFIISAEHGLVDLGEPLAAYDKHMAQLTAEERAQLGRRVIQSLVDRFGVFNAPPLEIHVFAGSPYVEVLRGALPKGWRIVEPLAGLTLFQRRSELRNRAARRASIHPPVSGGAMPCATGTARTLRVPALRVQQTPASMSIYSFAVDGKLISSFATVSRVRREEGSVLGYQRPEALKHVQSIRDYVESTGAVVPNAIVLAFDSRVTFEASAPGEPVSESAGATPGFLQIPAGEGEDWERPAFVVDGQQRLAAVRDAKVERFPLLCSAFITDDASAQREQFLLVNSTKPLPKRLIYELLPGTSAHLPRALERRKLPATLLERLNTSGTSPLRGMVKTATCPDGLASDTSFLQALENSLTDGVLYHYTQRESRAEAVHADLDGMERWVSAWWSAVRDTWPKEWGKKPKESRLLHGAGVISLGLLMDHVGARLRDEGIAEPTREQFSRELSYVTDVCAWSSGEWDFGAGQKRPWNQLQNTSQDCERLSRLLGLTYRERSRGRKPKRPRKTGTEG